jgi:hypothetical protein
MEYTERHHAFISATFFKKLRDGYGEKGLSVFVLATQRYAEQRGSRIEKKAIVLGLPLNFQTYFSLGEWNYSKGFLESVKGETSEVISYTPDYCRYVYACPWHEQYKAMGLLDGAVIYCKHLDVAIARGFNPYLDFRVTQTLHETDKCVFDLRNACIEEKPVKREEWVKPFEYHCAHIFHTFSEIVISILRAEGKSLSIKVLEDFSLEYGKEMADTLVSYENTNFNIISY